MKGFGRQIPRAWRNMGTALRLASDRFMDELEILERDRRFVRRVAIATLVFHALVAINNQVRLPESWRTVVPQAIGQTGEQDLCLL